VRLNARFGDLPRWLGPATAARLAQTPSDGDGLDTRRSWRPTIRAAAPFGGAKPSENLIYGLNQCAQWTSKWWPAKNEQQLKFQQGIHDNLCPQVQGMPYMGMAPGG
jgi:hypothetical protein